MSQAQYQVCVIEPNQGNVTGVFDGAAFYELRYNRALDDVGSIAFTVPSTAANRAAFSLDSFLEVYRSDPRNPSAMKLEETYLARLFQRFREGEEEKYLVGGYSLNHLLKRRVIDPAADGSATDGYSRKNGPADLIIHDYVNQQMGVTAPLARQFPNFSVASVLSAGVPVSAALRYQILYDAMFAISIPGRVDFNIVRGVGANTIMQIGQFGMDKTATTNYPIAPWQGLVPNRGNVQTPNFVIDRQNERTIVLALGQGQGLQRAVSIITAKGYLDSPFNRWEMTLDQNAILKTDTLGLGATGVGALYQYAPKKTFVCKVAGDEAGNTYHVDWDVGDTITAIWDELQADLRIWGVAISANGQGEQIVMDVRTSQNGIV
jgi:hypothetical protein